jgi:hypothetical protein
MRRVMEDAVDRRPIVSGGFVRDLQLASGESLRYASGVRGTSWSVVARACGLSMGGT